MCSCKESMPIATALSASYSSIIEEFYHYKVEAVIKFSTIEIAKLNNEF